ncbi:MAG TPA: hypothetical protein VIR03_00765 [Candidatus Saccharimonadales bacterium]
MSPHSDQTPGLRLPQPSFDVGRAPMGSAQPFANAMPPLSTAAQQPAPQPVAMGAAQPAPMGQPLPLAPASVAPVQESVQNENETAVDQEWIGKAREVIERTHTDPYTESNILSRLKAEYIKARYNKEIKVVEE